MNRQNEKVKLENNSIIIDNLVIEDDNTYKIVNDIKEDNREDFIKKAIIIGSIGLRNLYVDSNSSSLGKMRVLFEDYFDKRKGKISDLLSPFEDDSPIKKLKEEIFNKIQELRDELIKDKARGELIDKTSLKGGIFEDVVLEAVEDFCSEYEDKVAPVGEISGKRNKIGDITIDINGDENRRIIIECKDSSSYSYKKTIDEINDAIENRNAKFGIFLFKSQDQVPSAIAPVKITNNYIVT